MEAHLVEVAGSLTGGYTPTILSSRCFCKLLIVADWLISGGSDAQCRDKCVGGVPTRLLFFAELMRGPDFCLPCARVLIGDRICAGARGTFVYYAVGQKLDG